MSNVMTSRRAGMMVAALLALCLGWTSSARAADLSTPKAAVKAFVEAIVAGNSDDALAAAYTETDAQKEVVTTLTGLMKASSKFAKAATEKYGDAAKPIADAFSQGKAQMQNEMKKLDDAEVKIEGDTATVITKGDEKDKPAKVKKVGDTWKVDVTKMPDMPSTDDVGKLKKLVAALNDTADDINAGKLKTVEEMGQALQKRMGE